MNSFSSKLEKERNHAKNNVDIQRSIDDAKRILDQEIKRLETIFCSKKKKINKKCPTELQIKLEEKLSKENEKIQAFNKIMLDIINNKKKF